MRCDNCGRRITKIYHWQGKDLGSSCFKKVDPWSIDPAATLLLVAEKFVSGDKTAMSLIPSAWRRYLAAPQRVSNAREHAAIYGGTHARWLAILARNDIARTGQQIFSLADLLE